MPRNASRAAASAGRPTVWLAVWITLALPAERVAAQGLPAYMPINPMTAGRSGVYFQPYVDPRPGGVRLAINLDYASAIEYNIPAPEPSWLLDAELMRLSLTATRDLGPDAFMLAEANLNGAYNGFLDGFLQWYHNLFGFRMPERDARPKNTFGYQLALPGVRFDGRRSDLFLGDLRLGYGRRWTPELQSVLVVTLPTATGPDGYGRGTPSVSALNTVRTELGSRLIVEMGFGLGYTPTHGPISPYQRTVFASASSGARFRFWGRQALFANFIYHTPYYHDTQLPALDRKELTLDFGWLLARTGGGDWRIGLTEDLQPSGPAVDLIFRFGARF